MTIDKQVSPEEERRRFFRIEDLMHLTYRVIDKDELTEKVDMLEKGLIEQFMVMSSLAAISADMAATLRKIESVEPDVAAYLRALDRKIDTIGRAFMVDEVTAGNSDATAVNVSASGIAFDTNENLPVGALVELKMLLLPSCTGVLTYGEVVANDNVDEKTGFSTQVRIDFTHLRDEDRDMLIKHAIKKQGDMLRERRAAQENRPE